LTDERGRPTARDTQDQYSRQASHYATSVPHGRGETLATVRELAAAAATETALDIGTGTGFTAFEIAAGARRVVAADLTLEMLKQTRTLSRERGLEPKIGLMLLAAERLPFRSESLPLITSRTASHHFHDLAAALAEVARVLAPGGRFVLCDTVAPEPPALVELMNDWELRRDPSHVWNHPVSRWREELLPAAGLAVREVVTGRTPLVFSDWVRRSGTPEDVAAELRREYVSGSSEAREAFEIRAAEDDVYFSWPNVTILATKP
jgi:ubiquinone/menaquinone biosynthesis C-methylase UbiE